MLCIILLRKSYLVAWADAGYRKPALWNRISEELIKCFWQLCATSVAHGQPHSNQSGSPAGATRAEISSIRICIIGIYTGSASSEGWDLDSTSFISSICTRHKRQVTESWVLLVFVGCLFVCLRKFTWWASLFPKKLHLAGVLTLAGLERQHWMETQTEQQTMEPLFTIWEH